MNRMSPERSEPERSTRFTRTGLRGRGRSSVAVLASDLRARFGRGEPARVEEYLGRHPDLADDPEAILDLIYQEVVLREEHGESPRLEEYRRRFPNLGAPLADLFEVHAALEAAETVPPTRTAPADEAEVASRRAPGADAARRLDADPFWPEVDGYDIRSVLGRGGMGVVYQAFDRRRNSVVALKTMQRLDAGMLYRFKQEFRALLDVSHPNLVNLYELVSDGRQWFITMELVEGVPFLRYVRGAPAPPGLASTEPMEASDATRSTEPCSSGDPDASRTLAGGGRTTRAMTTRLESESASAVAGTPSGRKGLSPEEQSRLRAALQQLAQGVAALHAAGKLHRDIKPSNVLVEPAGRVVLMDFGLTTDLEPADHIRSLEGEVVGTVAYMAPEQAAGQSLTPASDWYSVGVILYESLTGRLPFQGTTLQVLMDKRRQEPPPPRELVANVPSDLDALCIELLRRDPRERPAGCEILRRLGCVASEPGSALGPPRSASPPGHDVPLIGRDRHRRALEDAFERVRAGRAMVLGIRGPSGVGKSTLVQQFVDDLTLRGAAVVLVGRCYECESVPYKALDSLIDALTRHLRRLPTPEAEAILPRDVGPLMRVFPVLRRVEAVATAPRRAIETPDPQELRRRAFAALRELLARLGDRRPLVLAIDDLQWGDADSLAALVEAMRPPDPPTLLLVGCYRSEESATGALLAELLAPGEPRHASVERRELAIDPLSLVEARDLAITLLGRADPMTEAQAELIARESGGSPLFVAELVRAVQADGAQHHGGGEDAGRDGIALDEVLWLRIARLPEPARRLLEVVAVSGRPVSPGLAWRCLGAEGDERGALGLLRTGRLVRGTATTDREAIETYHDRVRETVVAHLDPGVLRGHHRRLAHALEEDGGADPEVLGTHFQGAGEDDRAAELYAVAAAQASETLAFERAAALYRLALALRSAVYAGSGAEARRLRTGLADALANAGRGSEAALEYLAAARGAHTAEAFELRRRAALQFLISGHIDDGLQALRDVLQAVGMRLPATPRQAFLSFLAGRVRLALRGLGFHSRDPSELAAAELSRIDVCWTTGVGLSVVDWIRGADFQTRGLLQSLRAGEPYRIARALAMEAAHNATVGHRVRRRTARLLSHADELARRTGHPYAIGMVRFARGVSAYLEGRWRAALDGCDEAEAIFRDRCTGVAWELDTTHAFALWALTHLGEVAEMCRRFPRLLQEARERGDLYALMNLSTYNLSVVRLAADEPEPARDQMRRMMEQWSREGYHVQHNDQLWGAVNIELYRGDGAAARALIERHWPALARSLLLRVQFVRVSMTSLRARAALAAGATSRDPAPLLRCAGRDARRLARERVPWAVAHARLIEGLLEARGDPDAAAKSLAHAAACYDDADMALCAAATRRRLGVLIGGSSGRSLVEAADAWMTGQGIRNPARLAAMYAPEV
jgi:serine/threonine protein kinase